MKEIQLTQDKFALVDDEDFEYINQWKWAYIKSGNTGYGQRSDKKKVLMMHRVILDAPKGKLCDHINRNGIDNRRSNLRLCTSSQNVMNGALRSDNTSGYRGVLWRKQDKLWEARVKLNGKMVFVKLFKDLHEAVKARDEAAKVFHGEFAVLNFP